MSVKQENFKAQAKNKRLNSYESNRSGENSPMQSPSTPKLRAAKVGENLKVQINPKRVAGDMASPMPRTPSEIQYQKKLYSEQKEPKIGKIL